MDDGDPTTAGFNEFERVHDDAVNEFYEENARGDAAIVNVDNDSDDDVIVNVNDDSDAPPQRARSALWEQEKIVSPYGRRPLDVRRPLNVRRPLDVRRPQN